MALITAEELANYLRQTYDAGDASLTQAATLADGVVKGYCNQSIEQASFTEKIEPDGLVLELHERPVTAVTSVTGPTLGALTETTQYEWDGVNPWITLDGAAANELYLTVVYTAGFATVPTLAKAVALSIGARIYRNPGSVRSEQIDDYSVTYAGGGDGLTVSKDEARLLNRYRVALGSIKPWLPRMRLLVTEDTF